MLRTRPTAAGVGAAVGAVGAVRFFGIALRDTGNAGSSQYE